MIDSFWVSERGTFKKIPYEKLSSKIKLPKLSPNFVLKIKFKNKIIKYRNHDYTWVEFKDEYIFNSYCPKVILLENGIFVQPNFNIGYWEINIKKPFEVLWIHNPPSAKPIVNYDKQNNKIISSADNINLNLENINLLFSKKNAYEVSRSKIYFSAIACFTDHCDYDTLENLKIQRDFFKKYNIKITKGFFLNHFSKRQNNASYEHDSAEINEWRNDGHEIAYHSLTQSIRSYNQAFEEFKNFNPPFKIDTWIDHGFQPYNFTMYKRYNFSDKEYESVLTSKGIQYLWNYLDSGTSTYGVLNQLNTSQFTLATYYRGIKRFSFRKKTELFIKLLLVHYLNTPTYQQIYKNLASNFKEIRRQKKIQYVFRFIVSFLSFMKIFIRLIFRWRKIKNIPFEYAKYAPILYKNTINSKVFSIFQTLEMVDFDSTLKKDNIDSLISEKGMFIAHTYFSVPLAYHTGRLIVDGKINPFVEENFRYLSKKIKLREIWNPTLKELGDFLYNYENVEFDINVNEEIYPINSYNFNIRPITHEDNICP